MYKGQDDMFERAGELVVRLVGTRERVAPFARTGEMAAP